MIYLLAAVSRLLKQESISFLVGPDDLIFRLASSDQQTPLIAIGSGFREEALEGDGGKESGDESLLSAALTLQLMPAKGVFHRAVIDYVRTFPKLEKWEKNVAVIYDSAEGMMTTTITCGDDDDDDRRRRRHLTL